MYNVLRLFCGFCVPAHRHVSPSKAKCEDVMIPWWLCFSFRKLKSGSECIFCWTAAALACFPNGESASKLNKCHWGMWAAEGRSDQSSEQTSSDSFLPLILPETSCEYYFKSNFSCLMQQRGKATEATRHVYVFYSVTLKWKINASMWL